MALTPSTVHAAFVASAAAAAALTFGGRFFGASESATSKSQETPAFKAFQRTYIVVYLLMFAGDWLQGPRARGVGGFSHPVFF